MRCVFSCRSFVKVARLACLFLVSGHVYAQLPPASVGERYFYRGARALGMGGVQVVTVNDETAALINPANQLRLRGARFTSLDLELEASDTFYYPFYQTQPIGNPLNLDSVFTSISQNPDKNYYFRASSAPVFASEFFSLGALVQQSLMGRLNSGSATADAFYRDDQLLFAGIAGRMFDGHVKLGVTGRVISRLELDVQLPWPSVFSMAHQGRGGTALAYDVGLTLVAPVAWHPTLSVVARDLGGTRFDQSFFTRGTYATPLSPQKQTLDVGLGVFPIHRSQNRSVFAIEAHDVENMSKRSKPLKNLHVGYEFNYRDILFFRLGANQGQWTTGLEIASEYTQLQLAWYAEEMTDDDSISSPSRRLVLKWSFRF
jgi:hypothetical protein